jgi:hypothetical protein
MSGQQVVDRETHSSEPHAVYYTLPTGHSEDSVVMGQELL